MKPHVFLVGDTTTRAILSALERIETGGIVCVELRDAPAPAEPEPLNLVAIAQSLSAIRHLPTLPTQSGSGHPWPPSKRKPRAPQRLGNF